MRVITLFVVIVLSAAGAVAENAAPRFQDLMDPAVFPDPQFGMAVEEAKIVEAGAQVKTTGAEITVDADKGEIAFQQRLVEQRFVGKVCLGKPVKTLQMTHNGPGFARFTAEHPNITVRINGDSLCMIQAHEPLEITVRRAITPAWNASWKSNHLVVDELGGFAVYCSEAELGDQYDPCQDDVARYALPADAVLCFGVCPPKPYDWQRSLDQQVIWHWSNVTSYPPDDELNSWKPYGSMVLLQSEVMLWKDWNLDFVPRLGLGEWNRVRNTIHGMDMPYIVYTSPYFFLKGTWQEKNAVNDQPGVCPGSITSGENMPLFLEAITRVMRDLKPDGLYFDGQYSKNPAGLYALARHSRAVIGEKGILEWHSTEALGPPEGRMYMPHADAYTDIQLRGEGRDAVYGDFDYLRFFVSGYNINNCIGVLCTNSTKELTPELMEPLLEANGRLHTLIGNPQKCEFILKQYRPRLTMALQTFVDRRVRERQAAVPGKITALQTFLSGADWTAAPQWANEFDVMPEVQWSVSPANPDPFSIQDGCLHITAKTNTYAYLSFPLNKAIRGFELRLRQGTDGGMSWGPSALVRWSNGDAARIGARKNELQADIMGTQIIGPPYAASDWVWIRARWDNTQGVAEFSADGVHYQRYFVFYRKNSAREPVTELLVGKVPYNGLPQDCPEAGVSGECDIDFVRVYCETN